MLHVFLAVYIISFCLGVVVITLSLLAHARSGFLTFRHVALLFLSALLLLLAKALGIYEEATEELVFGGTLSFLSAALTVPGNAILAWMFCVFACGVVSVRVSPPRLALHIILAVVAGALGGMKELLPQKLIWLLNDALMIGIQLYATLVIVKHKADIRYPSLQGFVRGAVAISMIAVVAIVVQVIGKVAFTVPDVLRQFPLAKVLVYFAMAGFLVYHALRYLFEPDLAAGFHFPEGMAGRFGISPRESEIITMLVKGHTNKVIGEKLFISTTTVKNHIYHIYQKTGVKNKIQLINLINSPK